MRSIGRWLILLAGSAWPGSCGPKPLGEPPPQNPGNVPTPADAGLPVVPLGRRGVIVPSDVKLETPPKQATPAGLLTPPQASPGGP